MVDCRVINKKMTKPDLTKMTRKELKKYILSHPTDDEAIRELFINCRNPNVQVFPYPQNMIKIAM